MTIGICVRELLATADWLNERVREALLMAEQQGVPDSLRNRVRTLADAMTAKANYIRMVAGRAGAWGNATANLPQPDPECIIDHGVPPECESPTLELPRAKAVTP